MTINQIAAAIRSHIKDGLKEVYNHSYSIPLLEDEIINTRNSIIFDLSTQLGKLNPLVYAQTIEDAEKSIENMPSFADANGTSKVIKVTVPRLIKTDNGSSLVYVGPPDRSLDIMRYYDDSYKLHKFNIAVKHKPFVFVDMSVNRQGKHTLYIGNLGNINIPKITVVGIFENPYEAFGNVFKGAVEFPAPRSIQDKIIDILSRKYIEYYRKLHMQAQPNTQTEINN